MDHLVDVIELRSLWTSRKAIDKTGAKVSINLGRALANIHKDIAKMWEKRPGDKDTFYIQERSLYDPIFNARGEFRPCQQLLASLLCMRRQDINTQQ